MHDNFFLKPLSLLESLIINTNSLERKILILIRTIKSYLKGNECESLNDCYLLNKLLEKQPSCSERVIEYSWIIKKIKMAKKRERILDVGSTSSELFNKFVQNSVEMHAIDLNKKITPNNINFKKGDIRNTNYPNEYFDYVLCISSLEHIGVRGRYGSNHDKFGDYKAIQEMKRVLKKGGKLLITIPYGKRDVLPINKVYNKKRLNKLLKEVKITEKRFFYFEKKWDMWLETSESVASEQDMIKSKWYSICLIQATK